MKIGKRQIEELTAHQRALFGSHLEQFLRSSFPDAALSPDVGREVESACQRGRRYGMETEHELAVYVTTSWLFGGDFADEFPAANEVLNAQVPSAMKARFLEDWTSQILETLQGGSK